MLNMVESGNPTSKATVLTHLADLLAVSVEGVEVFHTWVSAASGRCAAAVVMEIWREEEGLLGTMDGNTFK